jgi:hypothetical protein
MAGLVPAMTFREATAPIPGQTLPVIPAQAGSITTTMRGRARRHPLCFILDSEWLWIPGSAARPGMTGEPYPPPCGEEGSHTAGLRQNMKSKLC